MYAQYLIKDYNQRTILGNGTTSQYAPSVLADLVGLLTGTITNVNQLSTYADKDNCFIQGTAGNWSVYDSDAHPGYVGAFKVLRRLCVDGLNYQYLFIGARVSSTDYLLVTLGFMGGWDTVTKTPATDLVLWSSTNNKTYVPAGQAVSTTNVPMTSSGSATGAVGSVFFNKSGATYTSSVPYILLNTPAVMAIWAANAASAVSFPMALIAEYESANPWSNGAAGVAPLVYGGCNSDATHMLISAPHFKNTVGTIVQPTTVNMGSIAGVGSTFHASASGVTSKYLNNAGEAFIPVVPIDVRLGVAASNHYCYAGRLRELFATLTSLNVGDTFQVGAETHIIIPTGYYNATQALYSPYSKLCARIQ